MSVFATAIFFVCEPKRINISLTSLLSLLYNIINRYYSHLAPELPTNAALEMLDGMRRGVDDFLNHDTTYASRYVDRHRQMTHGYSDPVRLRKRTPFTDKAGCFAEIGISGDDFPGFDAVVDAE